VLTDSEATPVQRYGLSCKMRETLDEVDKKGRVYIEVSNANARFWAHLKSRGIDQANYKDQPDSVGIALVELVRLWHQEESTRRTIRLEGSSYLVLSYNAIGWYQLHQFDLDLFDENAIHWYFPIRTQKGVQTVASGLRGDDASGKLVEWYGGSGGQLKFYPFAKDARWQSERFMLEPLPDVEHGILAKAAGYFPNQWAKACGSDLDNGE